MRILQAIAVLVGLGAGIFFIGGQFLPAKLEVSREGRFCHPPSRVFEALDTPGQIAAWSMFTTEAGIPVTHGDSRGPGGWVRWTGDEGEVIEWRIRDSNPPRSVEYTINFDDEFEASASGRIRGLDDEEVDLRMTLNIELESLTGRWGVMLLQWNPAGDSIGDAVEQEIANLKGYLADQAGDCDSEAAV